MRDKLIELIGDALVWDVMTIHEAAQKIADRLIFHGVTFADDNDVGNKPMTNGDRIRSMTDEELDEFLEAVTDACYDPSINHCRNCPMLGHRVGEDFCNITNWLKQLAEE